MCCVYNYKSYVYWIRSGFLFESYLKYSAHQAISLCTKNRTLVAPLYICSGIFSSLSSIYNFSWFSIQLLTATQSDAYLSNPAYKDYLEKELTSRKQDLLESWENSANSIMETERNNFVSLLSRNLLSEEIANSQNDTKKAGDLSITNLNMVRLTYHDKLIPLFSAQINREAWSISAFILIS